MIVSALYKIAGIFLLAKGVTGLFSVFLLLQQPQQPGEPFVPVALYASPLIYILLAGVCWFIPFRNKLETEEASESQLTAPAFLGIALFILGLFYLGNFLPNLVQQYLWYREFSSLTGVSSDFASEKAAIYVLLTKVLFGAVLVAISIKYRSLVNIIRSIGAKTI